MDGPSTRACIDGTRGPCQLECAVAHPAAASIVCSDTPAIVVPMWHEYKNSEDLARFNDVCVCLRMAVPLTP